MTRDEVLRFFDSLLGKVEDVYYEEAKKSVNRFIKDLDRTYKYKPR